MTLYLVIPCYNEEQMLPITSQVIAEKRKQLIESNQISSDSRVLFVDDGSSDRTWELIRSLHETDEFFTGIRLSRNRGHQNALLAGLEVACTKADAVISMDADLQDDISAIDAMIERYQAGYDIVYGVRASRDCDSAFKKATALGFYRMMERIGVELVYNHADYRLMSKRAIEGLFRFSEVNLFLRGLVPLVGYPSAVVTYDRHKRVAGESKYPLKKMLSFALEGITSLSVKPIRLIFAIGVLLLLLSGIFGFVLLLLSLFHFPIGMAWWIFFSIWFTCSLNLIAMGTIGEYIGKIYLETKHRPRYIIAQNLLETDNSNTKKEQE